MLHDYGEISNTQRENGFGARENIIVKWFFCVFDAWEYQKIWFERDFFQRVCQSVSN